MKLGFLMSLVIWLSVLTMAGCFDSSQQNVADLEHQKTEAHDTAAIGLQEK